MPTLGGFTDILASIYRSVEYCKATNRSLLIDTTKHVYKINFSNYFALRCGCPVDTDITSINRLLKTNGMTLFPNSLNLAELCESNYRFGYNSVNKRVYCESKSSPGIKIECTGTHTGGQITLSTQLEEDVILVPGIGSNIGAALYVIQNMLKFTQQFSDYMVQQYDHAKNILGEDYLCVQVRNTDLLSDCEELYSSNQELIHSYSNVYICTDNKNTLDFFTNKGVKNIFNFTTFPVNQHIVDPTKNYNNYKPVAVPLHQSDVPGDTQIKDLLLDIAIAQDSARFITNSVGGFTKLCNRVKSRLKTNIIQHLSC